MLRWALRRLQAPVRTTVAIAREQIPEYRSVLSWAGVALAAGLEGGDLVQSARTVGLRNPAIQFTHQPDPLGGNPRVTLPLFPFAAVVTEVPSTI